MKPCLTSSKYIDWEHSSIIEKAGELSGPCSSVEEIVKSCFTFVRDGIKHSNDYQIDIVTVNTSEALKYNVFQSY